MRRKCKNTNNLLSCRRKNGIEDPPTSCLMTGVMWVRRGRLLSRWKERMVVVTMKSILCYKETNKDTMKMGIRLEDIKHARLEERKGYMVVTIESEFESILVVRSPENLREWCNVVQNLVKINQNERMPSTEQFWSRKMLSDENEPHSFSKSTLERRMSSSSLDRRGRRRFNGAGKSTEINHKRLMLDSPTFLLTLIN